MTKKQVKNVLLIKARWSLDRILSIENYYWSSTQAPFVENYEIKFSRSNYTHILEYLCRVSFLTTLEIYKDYFKSRYEVMQSDNTCLLWSEAKITLVHHLLYKSYYVFVPRVLWPRSFLIFVIDELKNFVTNIFLKLVC